MRGCVGGWGRGQLMYAMGSRCMHIHVWMGGHQVTRERES